MVAVERHSRRPEGRTTPSGRPVLVGLAALVGAASCGWLTVPLTRWLLTLAATADRADAAALLTGVSAACCVVLVARLALGLALVAVTSSLRPEGTAHRRGRRLALALSPAWTRPLVTLLLATGVTAGGGACTAAAERHLAGSAWHTAPAPAPTQQAPAGQALARDGPAASVTAPAGSHRGPAPPQRLARDLPDPLWGMLPEPGWVPAPPPPGPRTPSADVSLVTSGARATGRSLPRSATEGDDHVVVHRGDSLWSITARHLGPGARDADVAAEWPRWWHANRSLIGDDPDLILPGTPLAPPD